MSSGSRALDGVMNDPVDEHGIASHRAIACESALERALSAVHEFDNGNLLEELRGFW
jgi:hypothetical protein